MKTVHTDIREMRKALHLAARGDYSVGGEPVSQFFSATPAASLIRNVLHAGQYAGWSGEDMMTALAYHLALGYEDTFTRLLDMANMIPSVHTVLTRETTDASETRMNTGP